MKKLQFLAILLFPTLLFAQQKTPFISRNIQEAGALLNSNGSLSALALTGIQYWGVGKKKKNFKLGLGARLTSSFGSNKLEYITAPAILTSGQTGPGVFFAEQITQNIDTLSLNSTQVNALNAYLALRYDFAQKWGIEFNIDLVGLSFGGNKDAKLVYGDGNQSIQNSKAKPTTLNALLISDNDLGSLNSAFMLSYKFMPQIKVLAGASFLFNEYTLESPVSYTNSIGTKVNAERYRTKQLMFGVGINYVFKHK
jgi:hypothetical protein